MCHNLPHIIWQTTAEGGLIWQNQAYLSLRDDVGGHTAHSLFDLILSKNQTTVKNRQSLHLSFQKRQIGMILSRFGPKTSGPILR